MPFCAWPPAAPAGVVERSAAGESIGVGESRQNAAVALVQVVDAQVVKTHAINNGVGRRQAEQARLGVARLGARRDRADFDETEAQRGQRGDAGAVLVQTGGQTDRVAEGQAPERDWLPWRI